MCSIMSVLTVSVLSPHHTGVNACIQTSTVHCHYECNAFCHIPHSIHTKVRIRNLKAQLGPSPFYIPSYCTEYVGEAFHKVS
jgi:hypothetical protein